MVRVMRVAALGGTGGAGGGVRWVARTLAEITSPFNLKLMSENCLSKNKQRD